MSDRPFVVKFESREGFTHIEMTNVYATSIDHAMELAAQNLKNQDDWICVRVERQA